MKAWRLEKLGGRLSLDDVPVPVPRPGSVLLKVEASALMSYLKAYVEGKLPFYNPPAKPFTIGTNAIGTIEAVGRDVWRLRKGQRVVVSSHFVARENVEDPAQILIGLTAGAGAADMLADWPDGTLAEFALVPIEAVTPLNGFETADAVRLAAVSRFVVPFGGLLRGRLAAGDTLLVNGATGAYGTAAVLLGVAMGAARVIAAGRSRDALAAVAKATGPRVATVALSGDVAADAGAIREASGGGAHIAFDMVGNASDPRSNSGGADESQAQRPSRIDGQHDRRPADPLYPAHAQQLGDSRPVHCIRRAPTGASSISSAPAFSTSARCVRESFPCRRSRTRWTRPPRRGTWKSSWCGRDRGPPQNDDGKRRGGKPRRFPRDYWAIGAYLPSFQTLMS